MATVTDFDGDVNNFVYFDDHLTIGREVDGLIDELTREVLEFHGEKGTELRISRYQATLRCFLANLARAWAKAPSATVGLSLRANDYSDSRYVSPDISYRSVRGIFSFVTDTKPPLVHHRRGWLDRRGQEAGLGPPVGRLTRIRATDTLMERIRAAVRSSAPEGGTHSITDNEISCLPLLIIQQEQESIRLRDEAKKLIPYDDTPDTEDMREALREWNDFALLHWVDLFLTDDEFQQIGFLQGEQFDSGDDHEETAPGVDLTRRRLYRVFNNGSFDQGGRFYGGWWQHIPSEYRRFITINWAPTRELDYSNMQAAMLYAMEGRELDGDAYSIDGIDPSRANRKLIKQTFFKLINAREGQKIRPPRRDQLPEGWTWAQVQEALRDKHAPIAKYLNSGIGIELQKIDSEIAEDVMHSLLEDDILVLPVHDSFVVYRAQYDRLKEEMLKAYRYEMGAAIKIDTDLGFADFLLGDEPVDPLDELDQFILDEWERRQTRVGYESYLVRKNHYLALVNEPWKRRFTAG